MTSETADPFGDRPFAFKLVAHSFVREALRAVHGPAAYGHVEFPLPRAI
jgi:hypothetical protein